MDLSFAELEHFLKTVSGWLLEPHGRCPSCARDDKALETAFCEDHRDEYRLSKAGALQARE